MIAHLQGVLVVKTVERVVLDVHGVGYQAVVPLSTYSRLARPARRVTLLTTMYVPRRYHAALRFCYPGGAGDVRAAHQRVVRWAAPGIETCCRV